MYKSEQIVSEDSMFNTDVLELDTLIEWSCHNPLLVSQEIIGLENQDETMDVNTKLNLVPNEFIPISPKGPPEREIFSGDLNFEIEICSADTNRSKFLYSHRLNRIYVFMRHGFPVRLKWDAAAQPYAAMFVRATPVFSDQAHAERRVARCIQHYHEAENDQTLTEAMRKSVLLSTREVGALDVFYCGGQSPDEWYSVVVRFTAPSTHVYQFACKNSCCSGINRRTIAIIFTLEDFNGKVYGRQAVGARACSCPKRDMKNEEREEAPQGKRVMKVTKRSPAPVTTPRTKKVRLEVRQEDEDSDEIFTLPPVSVVGRRVFNVGLRVMLAEMEESRAVAARAHRPTDKLDTCIAQMKQHLEKPNELK